MGIEAHCPNGHRIKVKDFLAGKKGLCPTCGAKFRIPKLPNAAADEGLPTAKLIELAPALVATLPRAMPFGQTSVAETPQRAEPTAPREAAAPAAATFPFEPFAPPPAPESLPPEPVFEDSSLPYLHPLIAEQPDLLWCIAFPGGEPTEPMPAATMQSWLDSRQAVGSEVVWRSDWPEWMPAREVFPEYFA